MAKSFNLQKCAIPSVWCGSGEMPNTIKDNVKYIRPGTAAECFKKGFGAGMNSGRKDPNSLRNIKYVGEVHEANFKKYGISDLKSLVRKFKSKTPSDIEVILKSILVKKGKKVDVKAYNSVLVYLYMSSISNLPTCKSVEIDF